MEILWLWCALLATRPAWLVGVQLQVNAVHAFPRHSWSIRLVTPHVLLTLTQLFASYAISLAWIAQGQLTQSAHLAIICRCYIWIQANAWILAWRGILQITSTGHALLAHSAIRVLSNNALLAIQLAWPVLAYCSLTALTVLRWPSITLIYYITITLSLIRTRWHTFRGLAHACIGARQLFTCQPRPTLALRNIQFWSSL